MSSRKLIEKYPPLPSPDLPLYWSRRVQFPSGERIEQSCDGKMPAGSLFPDTLGQVRGIVEVVAADHTRLRALLPPGQGREGSAGRVGRAFRAFAGDSVDLVAASPVDALPPPAACRYSRFEHASPEQVTNRRTPLSLIGITTTLNSGALACVL